MAEFDRAAFKAEFDVSRETMERLQIYADLLVKWSPRINLVAKPTLGDKWHRHFADSAQILKLAPVEARQWIDLGSGGGFPGLVVAILASAQRPDLSCTLVDSDERKSEFLRTVVRETGIRCAVETARIEALTHRIYDVISARALASLSQLLSFAEPFLGPDSVCLFLKGRRVESELTEARRSWHTQTRVIPSQTHPDAAVLLVEHVRRANER